MSSAPRNPSILALNRFLEPSVFNTGPPIPKVVPVAISPSTTPGSDSDSKQDIEATRRATGTPDLTSSPSSSNSSLPSTSSAPSRSSSPSSSTSAITPAPPSNLELLRAFALSRGIQPYGRPPVRVHRVRVPLESDHIKQIFAQPLLSDIIASGSEAQAEADLERQKDDEALAEKMRLHMSLLSRPAQVDGVDASYPYGYPPYHCDNGAYMHPYAEGYAPAGGVVPEGMFYAYDPAHGPFYHEADGQYAYAYIPDDYYYGHPQELPQGAYTYLETDTGFPAAQEPNANLNPNATPFVPSTAAPAASSVESDKPTSADSELKCAPGTQESPAPLHPPGLPIPPQAQSAVCQ